MFQQPVSGYAAFGLLVVVLVGMAWGFRTVLLALLVQSAERGQVIPMSLVLARVPVPQGERFVLSVPARAEGASWTQRGSLVLTDRRVRLVRRGTVLADLPLVQVAHLTVTRGVLQLTARPGAADLRVRVPQAALLARYVQQLASRALQTVAPVPRR